MIGDQNDESDLWSIMLPISGISKRTFDLGNSETELLDDQELRELHHQILNLFSVSDILQQVILQYNHKRESAFSSFARVTTFEEPSALSGKIEFNRNEEPELYAQILILNNLARQVVEISNDAGRQANGVIERWNTANTTFRTKWGLALRISAAPDQ